MGYKDEDIITKGFGFILFIVIMLCLFISCGVCKNCEYRFNETDSVYIEKIDSVFFTDTLLLFQPQDSSVSNILPDTEPSHLETDLAISDAWVEGGNLYHTLENKKELIPIQVQMPNAITRETKNHFHIVTKMVERDFKWWEEALMFIGRASIFLILLFLIIKLIKSKL